MNKLFLKILYLVVIFVIIIGVYSCVDTKSPKIRVTLFLTMVKSKNYKDALNYIESEKFSKSIIKKISQLSNEMLLEMLKITNMSNEYLVSLTDSVKLNELRSNIVNTLIKSPNFLEMTLDEMSKHIQNKEFEPVWQIIDNQNGQVYVKFIEKNTSDELIIFYVEKVGSEWKISGMEELITGWFF